MADFEVVLPALLAHEGGFVNDPDDPGGATNKGITMRTFQTYAQSLLGIEATLENLKSLTDEQAAKIYKREYWDNIKGDEIPFQPLANIVFDFYVNAGTYAAKLLQKSLNHQGAKLRVDGVIGENTLNALDRLDPFRVYRQYKKGRIDYYRRLVAHNPRLRRFLHGWLNRTNSFPDI